MLKTVSSITNALGALNYKGTWDANANSPALASSVGTKGDYYVVGTAGSTNLNGISNWGVGDLATFNGSVWERVEGGADLNGVNLSVSGTSTLSGLTASTALALNASKQIVSVIQPAFSASLSTNQTVTAGTSTKITFNTEQFDTNSNYDNATNYRFTPTVAGYYQINVALDLADVFTGTQDVLLRLFKNGSQYLAAIRRQTGAGNEVGITLPQLVSMDGSTDYLEVYLQVVGATNCVVYATSNFSGSLARAA